MLTAMQHARITVTNHLIIAREELIKCNSKICYKDGRAHMLRLANISSEIDAMLAELVPNEAVDEPKQEF